MMRLQGKVALVTGGGSGIGRATATLFAAEGARVAVADNRKSAAQGVVDEITDAEGQAVATVGDVSSTDDARKMVQAAVEAYGRLDILVNSAGLAERNAVEPGAPHEKIWDRVIDVNLKGTYLCAWHAVPEMKRTGGGSIVNIASIIGLVGHLKGMSGPGAGFNAYAPSKGGVVNFTRNLAIDLALDNIRVNGICPGYTKTPLTRPLTDDEDAVKFLEGRHPMGRLGRPEEIAYAALFLASDEASFITGAPLPVDGGYTAQ